MKKSLIIYSIEYSSDNSEEYKKYLEEREQMFSFEKEFKKLLRVGYTTRIETHKHTWGNGSGYTITTQLVAYKQRHSCGDCETCPYATYEFAGNGHKPCGQFRCWDDCH